MDVVVVGGGIAGLWLLNRLVRAGYSALLLEHQALGSDQTSASQGMIHGGVKYALSGALTGASEAIAAMPDHWRACLRGEGDVDLRGARVLSDHFYLWSSGSAVSKLTTFFASKAVRGRVDAIAGNERPALFQPDALNGKAFKGSLYKLADMVLDVPSVIAALAGNCPEATYLIDWPRARWGCAKAQRASLDIDDADGGTLTLAPAAFVLAAGQGNGALLDQLAANSPRMQRRPLQQVMVKHAYPHRFYGHCLGLEATPRLTISSHPCDDGEQVWYLGGTLAEKGAHQSAAEVIARAQRELAELMPWVDLGAARWAALTIDRAEPQQSNFARPDQAFASWIDSRTNVIAAWPTKLTLAPNLASTVLELLAAKKIAPSGRAAPTLPLPRPPLAPAPWQTAFER
ncbi:MAG: FAD-dependent oxidoreductase [Porticoccaceae bacterium]